jgi:hypothetical protein
MEGKRPRRDRKGIEQERDIGKIVETTSPSNQHQPGPRRRGIDYQLAKEARGS